MSNGGRYLLGGALVLGGGLALSGRFEPLSRISTASLAWIPGPVAIGLIWVACGLVMLISKKPSWWPQDQDAHPPALAAERPQDSAPFDRTMLKQRFLTEMQPATVLATLRRQRRINCELVIQHFASLSGAYSDAIDDTVDWALSDADITNARRTLESCGFTVDIGTYEDPGHRALYVGVRLNADADRAMANLERL